MFCQSSPQCFSSHNHDYLQTHILELLTCKSHFNFVEYDMLANDILIDPNSRCLNLCVFIPPLYSINMRLTTHDPFFPFLL